VEGDAGFTKVELFPGDVVVVAPEEGDAKFFVRLDTFPPPPLPPLDGLAVLFDGL